MRGELHYVLFPNSTILEHRHEKRFACQQSLARTKQRADQPAVLLEAVTEDGFHFDAILHVHHAASFGDCGFHRIKLKFDELQVVAINLVIH